MKQVSIYLMTILFLTSCSGILPHRSFSDEMHFSDDPLFMPGEDFPVVGGDSGEVYRSREDIRKRTPMFDQDYQQDKEREFLEKELAQKEREMTIQELTLYQDVKPYLQNLSEHVYFVGLTMPEKVEYARSRRIEVNPSFSIPAGDHGASLGSGRGIASLNPRQNDKELYLGMTKYEVSSSWGRPSQVEVAGNPMNENERWIYRENGKVRYVYFESGYLQGWESN